MILRPVDRDLGFVRGVQIPPLSYLLSRRGGGKTEAYRDRLRDEMVSNSAFTALSRILFLRLLSGCNLMLSSFILPSPDS